MHVKGSKELGSVKMRRTLRRNKRERAQGVDNGG